MTKRPGLEGFGAVGLAALALASACATTPASEPPQQAQLARAIESPSRLAAPEHLPESARALLRTRMVSHARDMGDLMSAIMVLEYPRIQGRAEAIAGDASLARPLTGDATELNALLPEKFFLLQDELKVRARALADAAGRTSPFDVADSYGRVSETCVRCHAVYRTGR